MKDIDFPAALVNDRQQLATFATGCFWSAQLRFECISGVLSTQVGFMNGRTQEPTFEDVVSDTTGHALVVQVLFDATAITYEDLLEYFWAIETAFDDSVDLGSPYRAGIYYHTQAQAEAAVASKKKHQTLQLHPSRDIVTEIVPASTFFPAEDYHQRYLEKGGLCNHEGDTVPCCG
ncbi:Aste57867_22929 [Aphanomyces stellatus]|uniref:peptide-methionine (S)-S-oxide reductase n=1 Tax=Aphanomyces stellatus TaxID=120398 RepID=A0A485LLB5_9STRA|nr:hypothetical protein As57867_022858 [Aphanomyces stellatus]VFT99579.1 Aste57867_22929 [Aphanomyces stellatus]